MELEGSLPCSQEPTCYSLLWDRWIQSKISHTITLRSILILSFHQCLGLLSDLFLSSLPTKILYAYLISPIYAACPTNFILLDLIILIIFGKVHKLMKLLIMHSSPASHHFLPVKSKYLFTCTLHIAELSIHYKHMYHFAMITQKNEHCLQSFGVYWTDHVSEDRINCY